MTYSKSGQENARQAARKNIKEDHTSDLSLSRGCMRDSVSLINSCSLLADLKQRVLSTLKERGELYLDLAFCPITASFLDGGGEKRFLLFGALNQQFSSRSGFLL